MIRIGLRLDVKTAVENRAPLLMLDEIRRHGYSEASLFTGEAKRGRKGQPSARERINVKRHIIQPLHETAALRDQTHPARGAVHSVRAFVLDFER